MSGEEEREAREREREQHRGPPEREVQDWLGTGGARRTFGRSLILFAHPGPSRAAGGARSAGPFLRKSIPLSMGNIARYCARCREILGRRSQPAAPPARRIPSTFNFLPFPSLRLPAIRQGRPVTSGSMGIEPRFTLPESSRARESRQIAATRALESARGSARTTRRVVIPGSLAREINFRHGRLLSLAR